MFILLEEHIDAIALNQIILKLYFLVKSSKDI